MTRAATDIAGLGAQVDWPDAEAAANTRAVASATAGRTAEFAEWLAGTQGVHPPRPPSRVRLAAVGGVSETVRTLAASLDVTVRDLEPPHDAGAAFEAGVAAADDAAESGVDLLLVTASAPDEVANAVVVSLLCAVEPTALLPRGGRAVDTAGWIRRAGTLRDARHAAADLRTDPDALLRHLQDPGLAGVTGLLAAATARRTPVVLDGASAVVAALLVADVARRATRWWLVADTDDDPVHTRAVSELEHEPVLRLDRRGDGTAAVLCVPVLRASAEHAAAGTPS
ncbi:nicotinate-nucleotide--dimethylbenzimidazole phosphoribosyltransferase [Jatrophihabitans fulvus]